MRFPKWRLFTQDRGYQDQLNSSPLMSLRAKRSNLRHHEIASAQCASQWQSLYRGFDEHLACFVGRGSAIGFFFSLWLPWNGQKHLGFTCFS